MLKHLHRDLYTIIFPYMFQIDLIRFLLLNRDFYQHIMKYIKQTRFIKSKKYIISFIRKNKYFSFNNLLYELCLTGQKNIIKSMFYVKWYHKIYHEFMKFFFIEFFTNKYYINWNYGLKYACMGGHMKIVKFLIKKGANHWNLGLYGACEGGHMEIVEFMIKKGANKWNWGLDFACKGGHMEIVKLMIEKGAYNWIDGLYYACRKGHFEIVKIMIEKGAYICFYCKKSIEEHLEKND